MEDTFSLSDDKLKIMLDAFSAWYEKKVKSRTLVLKQLKFLDP